MAYVVFDSNKRNQGDNIYVLINLKVELYVNLINNDRLFKTNIKDKMLPQYFNLNSTF